MSAPSAGPRAVGRFAGDGPGNRGVVIVVTYRSGRVFPRFPRASPVPPGTSPGYLPRVVADLILSSGTGPTHCRIPAIFTLC